MSDTTIRLLLAVLFWLLVSTLAALILATVWKVLTSKPADREPGRDIAWARADADAKVRQVAARADHIAGRDIAWARADTDAYVRQVAAWADRDAGRDLAWVRADTDADVRYVAACADRDAVVRESMDAYCRRSQRLG